jgi:hypothetical protein
MVVYDTLDLYIPNEYRHPTGHTAIFGYFWPARSKYPTVMVAAFECKLPNKSSGAVSLQRQTADNFVSKRAYLRNQ